MWKKAKIILLDGNTESNITMVNKVSKQLIFHEEKVSNNHNVQHLYIISDEEIKKSDWCFDKNITNPIQIDSSYPKEFLKECCKKIIATTDELIINKYDDRFKEVSINRKSLNTYLPRPSQSFLELFVSEYDKGNIITEVMVEYEPAMKLHKGEISDESYPKDNTINIKKVKDSFSREEVKTILYKHFEDILKGNKQTLEEWIEENLPELELKIKENL